MELSILKNYSQESFNRLNYDDTGPHREMAIDCPMNFVGSKKEPPRYPRPLSIIQNQPQPTTGINTKNIKTINKESISKPLKEEEINQQNRMKKYQEDIQKRKEQEDKLQREQEFLRTSLRGSKKLQELKDPPNKLSPNISGFVNPNYICEDEFAARKRKRNMIGSHLEAEDIVASVNHVQKYLEDPVDREELAIISQFVLDERFQQLLKVHNKVVEARLNGVEVSSSTPAQEASSEVLQSISLSNHYAAKELGYLLHHSIFKNLILAHDKIAKFGSEDPLNVAMSEAEEKEYLIKRTSMYGESSIKIVRISKTSEPLGATVKNDGESVVISRIVKGSMADQSGLLHEGDEILEINEVDVRGKTINDVSEFMYGLNGQLTFLIHPSQTYKPTNTTTNSSNIHLRALFNYDPDDDNYIPCRELGFSFMKGEILHVIDTKDLNWWQAYREGEEDQPLAGLIPSPSFQLQREELKQLILGDMKENRKNQKRCHCVSKKKNNLNQISFDSELKDYLTYEEVALYYPQPNKKRPIALIGPKDVGRQELRQKLMKSDHDRFAAAIPHTSRPPKVEEINHQDYHFVSKQEFEAEIANNKFVEYGIFEKHYFGTSMDAIRQVVNSGKICLLNLYPQALKILKMSDLKPFFIFIAPPNIETLKQFKIQQGLKYNDETLKSIIQETREIEDEYGHYFDQVIIITDLDRAYEELLFSINQLEVQPQWVPTSWLT